MVATRAGEVFGHADGMLDLGEPERLHDMRVATRRLRAALEIFEPCFPRKRFGKTLKRVKTLADALGERRDRDVAIESLEEMTAGVAADDRPALEALDRAPARGAAPGQRGAGLGREAEAVEEAAASPDEARGGGEVKARPVEGLDPAAPLRPNAARSSATRLAELRAFAEDALEPEAASAQHEMRIAAKRLRYVLEIVEGCFGPEATTARQAAKRLQGVLGEIHDCDVMLPRAAGIESLEMLLRTRRELLFQPV